jgi:hypothetical protein
MINKRSFIPNPQKPAPTDSKSQSPKPLHDTSDTKNGLRGPTSRRHIFYWSAHLLLCSIIKYIVYGTHHSPKYISLYGLPTHFPFIDEKLYVWPFLCDVFGLILFMGAKPLSKDRTSTEEQAVMRILRDHFKKDVIASVLFFMTYTSLVVKIEELYSFKISGHWLILTMITTGINDSYRFINEFRRLYQPKGFVKFRLTSLVIISSFFFYYGFYCTFFTTLFHHTIVECLLAVFLGAIFSLLIY